MGENQKFPQMGVISVPVLDMRAEPYPRSEIVSQALFSEEIRIFGEIDEWCRIETTQDRYRGWALKSGAYVLKEKSPLNDPKGNILQVSRFRAHVYHVPDTIYGPVMTLPFESRLVAAAPVQEGVRWIKVFLPDGSIGCIQRGDVLLEPKLLTIDEACDFSHKFLGLPYTWGGRSSFGYDCSGFVQMVYRQMGLVLPRDAKDQANWEHFEIASVEELVPGDLIFYGNSEGRVLHVGMSLGDGSFIHTSAVTENMPYVRVSSVRDPAWNGSGYYPYMCGRKKVT